MRKHRLTLRILSAICGRLIFFQKQVQPHVNEDSFTAMPIFSSRIPTSHAAGKNPLPPRPRVLHTRSTHLYQEKKPTAQQRQMNRLLAIREPTKWIDHGGYVTSRRPAPRLLLRTGIRYDADTYSEVFLLQPILASCGKSREDSSRQQAIRLRDTVRSSCMLLYDLHNVTQPADATPSPFLRSPFPVSHDRYLACMRECVYRCSGER